MLSASAELPSSENCGDYDARRGRLSSDQAGKAQPVAVPVGESLTITLAFLTATSSRRLPAAT